MNNLLKNSHSKFAKILFRSLGVSCVLITTAFCSNNEVNKVNGGSEKRKKNGNKNGKKKNKLEHDKEKKDEKDDDELVIELLLELKREKDFHASLKTMEAKKQECCQLVNNLIKKLKEAKSFIFLEYFIIEEGEVWNSVLEIIKQKVGE